LRSCVIKGTSGWRKVDKHISTGTDDRLRVYFRVLQTNTAEVRVWWKSDDGAQEDFHSKLPD
jgi:hypothetical protein